MATKVPQAGNPRRPLRPLRSRSLAHPQAFCQQWPGRPGAGRNPGPRPPCSKRSPITGRPRLCISHPMKRASACSSIPVLVSAAPPQIVCSPEGTILTSPAATLSRCCWIATGPTAAVELGSAGRSDQRQSARSNMQLDLEAGRRQPRPPAGATDRDGRRPPPDKKAAEP